MFEVELRGLLSEKKYTQLMSALKTESTKQELDNKTTHFFSVNNGILKVVHGESNNINKLSFKIGDEYSGKGMKEIEVILGSNDQTNECISMLCALGYDKKSTIYQKRINFLYKDVSISLKYTSSWAYHFEAEILVENEFDIPYAHECIKKICDELDIAPMTPDELKKFVSNLDKK